MLLGTSTKSLRQDLGRTTVFKLCLWAASTFSLIPPTGNTTPDSDSSPVIATSSRTRRQLSNETNATQIATPAEGPSFGAAKEAQQNYYKLTLDTTNQTHLHQPGNGCEYHDPSIWAFLRCDTLWHLIESNRALFVRSPSSRHPIDRSKSNRLFQAFEHIQCTTLHRFQCQCNCCVLLFSFRKQHNKNQNSFFTLILWLLLDVRVYRVIVLRILDVPISW
jgi:hypothetical protein